MPEKPGYTFGELLKLISNGKMSLAQASYYGHSFYNIESALAYLEKALQSHGEEERRKAIEEQLKHIPMSNQYKANRYDTNNEAVLHLWDENGNSYDIKTKK